MMKFFLEASSDPNGCASVHIPELKMDAQPLVWALRRKGKLQRESADHISNVVDDGLQAPGLNHVSCQSTRGATTSKIVQCVPAFRPEALKMGRWTANETFKKSHETGVVRVPRLDDEGASSCQQVLRWGFDPPLPRGI